MTVADPADAVTAEMDPIRPWALPDGVNVTITLLVSQFGLPLQDIETMKLAGLLVSLTALPEIKADAPLPALISIWLEPEVAETMVPRLPPETEFTV
ncbi:MULTISPECIES: hypothetical protein [Novosphingobium]|jgi:hypothetical protein|uniref:hypothetical protein n=1 Tax=Novosphingobium TaxID=165696 RepID=UPI000580A6E8|nr:MULTISPECIES: hypothetical protein [Novosphingobium]QOV96263.1 hypothetical protein IM701_18330 [Novosphingobium sp. ES2-1]